MLSKKQDPPVKKNAFVHKLYTMLGDPKLAHLIWWTNHNQENNTFALYPGKEFANALTGYFKHGNVASFVRQLHMYGFHKVSDPSASSAHESASEKSSTSSPSDVPPVWEFKHSSGKFKKDDESSLIYIKRRSSSNSSRSSYSGDHHPPAFGHMEYMSYDGPVQQQYYQSYVPYYQPVQQVQVIPSQLPQPQPQPQPPPQRVAYQYPYYSYYGPVPQGVQPMVHGQPQQPLPPHPAHLDPAQPHELHQIHHLARTHTPVDPASQHPAHQLNNTPPANNVHQLPPHIIQQQNPHATSHPNSYQAPSHQVLAHSVYPTGQKRQLEQRPSTTPAPTHRSVTPQHYTPNLQFRKIWDNNLPETTSPSMSSSRSSSSSSSRQRNPSLMCDPLVKHEAPPTPAAQVRAISVPDERFKLPPPTSLPGVGSSLSHSTTSMPSATSLPLVKPSLVPINTTLHERLRPSLIELHFGKTGHTANSSLSKAQNDSIGSHSSHNSIFSAKSSLSSISSFKRTSSFGSISHHVGKDGASISISPHDLPTEMQSLHHHHLYHTETDQLRSLTPPPSKLHKLHSPPGSLARSLTSSPLSKLLDDKRKKVSVGSLLEDKKVSQIRDDEDVVKRRRVDESPTDSAEAT